MEIRQYAPVIIPTLNRYEHFKRCLESLEKCKGAEHTNVYVALDFPPSEKYVEGWKKIDVFLAEKEKKNSFKKLIVYRRKENYFFSGKGNAKTAIDDLPSDVDRYILSEDDNVFSYRFLDFINRGLEDYKDNREIFAICGYMHPYGYNHTDYQGNCVLLQEMSAWGYGTWLDRCISKERIKKKISEFVSDKQLRQHFELRRLDIFTGLLMMESQNIIWSDCFNTANLYATNRYCIFPLISLVQNHGWDGSGTHGGKVEGFATQEIEGHVDKDFVFTPVSDKERDEIDRYVIRYWRKRTSTAHRILDLIEVKLYAITGKIYMFKGLINKAKQIRFWWYSRNK